MTVTGDPRPPMNPVLAQVLASNTVEAADGRPLPLHSHMPELECRIMQRWLQLHRCRTTVEIGLGYGISTLFICDALAGVPGAIHHVIDPHQHTHWQGIGLRHLAEAGYQDLVRFHDGFSELVLPRLLEAGLRCDFALIDGRHTFDQALVDFYFVNRLLVVNGIVVLDDSQLPGIQRLLSHVATYPCYAPLALPEEMRQSTPARVRRLAGVPEARVAAFVKITDDERAHDWHVEF